MKRLQKYIFKQVRNANLNFGLIETGDRVAVGISGGKDSLTLLHFLALLQKYTPLDFEIRPVYLDLGWENDITAVQNYCESIGIPLLVEKTNIGQVVFNFRQEKNPCSLCSNLRRGALNRTAKSLGCNKVALGHHADDAVHTLFLSMLFEGRHSVFKAQNLSGPDRYHGYQTVNLCSGTRYRTYCNGYGNPGDPKPLPGRRLYQEE